MNLKKVIISLIMFCLLFDVSAYAVPPEIICDTSVNGNKITLTGQIKNSEGSNQVTLLVGEEKNIIYLNQFESMPNGEFNFTFPLASKVSYGNYRYWVGSDTDAPVYNGILYYIPTAQEVVKKIFDTDLTVSISGYTPKVTGTILCLEDKSITFEVKNKSDDTVIFSDIITPEDGEHNLSFTFPSLLSPKEYELTLSCRDDGEVITYFSAILDSSILAVNAEATVSTTDDVTIDAQMKTVNTGLLDKETTFTGNKTVSAKIPNLAGSASFNLKAQGYKKEYEIPEMIDAPSVIRTFSGKTNDEVYISIGSTAVAALEGKTFKLEYNPDQLQLISILDSNYSSSGESKKNEDIEIISRKNGEVVFLVNSKLNSTEKNSGIINLFKFKFLENYSGSTTITLR